MIGSHIAHIHRVNRPGRKPLFHVVAYTPADGFTSIIVDNRTLRDHRRFCIVLMTKTGSWFQRPEYLGPDGREFWQFDVTQTLNRPAGELPAEWIAEVKRCAAAMRQPLGV